MVWCVEHTCRRVKNFGKSHLYLSDAMAPVLSVAKCRSSALLMLRVCRQIGALSLASVTDKHWRWQPSERNSADDASRNQQGNQPSAFDVGHAGSRELSSALGPNPNSACASTTSSSESQSAASDTSCASRSRELHGHEEPPGATTPPGSTKAAQVVASLPDVGKEDGPVTVRAAKRRSSCHVESRGARSCMPWSRVWLRAGFHQVSTARQMRRPRR